MDSVNGTTRFQSSEQNDKTIVILQDNLDDFFLVLMGSIILFLQAGFAFLEAGFIRRKNTTSILLKNFLDSAISCLLYWLVGYAFAYGDGNSFIGTRYFALTDLPRNKYSHWFFQYAFAATSTTIVSGSVAERCSMVTYFAYSVLISGFVYPVISHWAWSEKGWLKALGFVDFAGSGVVHLTGGAVSILAAYIVGPRIGRIDSSGKFKEIPGHSVPLALLGTFILNLGFLAFNGGSQGSIVHEGDGIVLERSVFNTVLSGAGGAITALFFNRFVVERKNKQWSCLTTINGSIIGMVSVCSGCNQYTPLAALSTGVIAALVFIGLRSLLPLIKLDDPLDAVPVHFGGGLWGLFALPFLGPVGIIQTWSLESGKQLLYNLVGAIAICCWSWLLAGTLFSLLRLTGYHRPRPEVEILGLDWAVHKEPAYPYESNAMFFDKAPVTNQTKVVEINSRTRPPSQAWRASSLVDTITGPAINPAFYM